MWVPTMNDTIATQRIHSEILCRPTAKARILAKLLRPPHNVHRRFCDHLTLEDCARSNELGEGTSNDVAESAQARVCSDIHFQVLRYPQTDDESGHCSYLSSCHRTSTCKYLHFLPVLSPECPEYEWKCQYPDWARPPDGDAIALSEMAVQHPSRRLREAGLESWIRPGGGAAGDASTATVYPPQLLNADLKTFDLTVLGKFDVIVQDSAFDIHMSLPYGTVTDNDIRSMPIAQLQDDGFIFFWVTGRAMELGRELLEHWGYSRVDELVWVKVGQTQRLIRTGRTGHWLNHTKEHCLVGAKSSSPSSPLPSWAHLGLDSDVLVSEVRDTSRKPDELYGMIERLCPGGRKLELFGRRHNARTGWLTVGNQLKKDEIHDPELQRRLDEYRSRGANATSQPVRT
ncbi:unnamed protein product [Parajaminaea phylloscopi]